MSKLTRREAALVRNAKRLAVKEYELTHFLTVKLNACLVHYSSLAVLKHLSVLNSPEIQIWGDEAGIEIQIRRET